MSEALQKSKSLRGLSTQPKSIFTDSVTTLMRSTVVWSFTRSQRFRMELPTTVNVPLSPAKGTLSKTAASLRCGNRHTFKPMITPGPDAYSPLSNSARSCVFSRGKHQTAFLHAAFTASKHVPGPGAYSIARQLVSRERAIAFKGKRREIDSRAGQPGPGHYSPQKHAAERRLGKGGSFGSSTRSDFMKTETVHVPGPGAYEVPTRFRKAK